MEQLARHKKDIFCRRRRRQWQEALQAVKGVMCCLKGKREVHICLGSEEPCLEGYMVVNYDVYVEKQRYTPRYAFILNGNKFHGNLI